MDIFKVHFEDGNWKEWAWNHGVKVQVVMNVLCYIFRSTGAWRWFTFCGHVIFTVISFTNPCSSIISNTLLGEYPKDFFWRELSTVCSVHFYQCVSFKDVLDDWSNFDGTFKYVHIHADYLLKSFHLPVLVLTAEQIYMKFDIWEFWSKTTKSPEF
jgi:hypothetical protein